MTCRRSPSCDSHMQARRDGRTLPSCNVQHFDRLIDVFFELQTNGFGLAASHSMRAEDRRGRLLARPALCEHYQILNGSGHLQ